MIWEVWTAHSWVEGQRCISALDHLMLCKPSKSILWETGSQCRDLRTEVIRSTFLAWAHRNTQEGLNSKQAEAQIVQRRKLPYDKLDIAAKSMRGMKWKSFSLAAACVIVGHTTGSPLSEQLLGIAILWLKLSTQKKLSKVRDSCGQNFCLQ